MTKPVDAVRMDSRKFLNQLNESAQAKVSFFEERVAQMGKQGGKNWRLAALHAKDLYIEDVDSHDYYVANHARDHGKISITNIRPIQIVEEEKKELFEDTIYKLVTAIEENDQKGMAGAFNRLKGQRFSSRAVPNSGMVRCRDGVLRHVNIASEGHLDRDVKGELVAAIVESLSDRVIVENGHVSAGFFGDQKVKLPVTKWGMRKLVAKRMQDAAKNAYWSEGFQSRVYNLAKLISEDKIEEAVQSVSKFLNEMEEFTLLNREQTQALIENALAAKAVFNESLCKDTATLFHRTNLKVNRSKFIEEFRNIAKKAEHAVLAENVNILESSKNFEAAHDKFIHLLFEAISNREVAAEALATTLHVLRDKTPKIKESHELSSKLNGLISRLKQKNFDDAAIYEAEDLIATIQEELAANETLANFDQMPGDMDDPAADADAMETSTSSSGAPVININSPLIQIGGSSGKADEEAMPEMPAEEGDPELDALLGGGDEAAAGAPPAPPAAPTPPPGMGAAPAAAPAPLMQSRERKGKSLAESIESWDDDDARNTAGRRNPDGEWDFRDMKADEEEDEDVTESRDPYAIRKDEKVATEGLRFTDYGAPVLTDEGDIDRIMRIMQRIATEHKLVGAALSENLESLAKTSIRAAGLRIPQGKFGKAVEEAVVRFEEWQKPWLKDKDEECDDEECEDEEDVVESQYKYPWRRPRGFDRSRYENRDGTHKKGAKSESKQNLQRAINEGVKWVQTEADGMLGEFGGVRFVLDHGGQSELPPVVLSEDGAVELPIPEELHDSAYAAANLIEGDARGFLRWLSQGPIEQLRPISSEEDAAIEEAMTKIIAGPDGSISVEVSSDVEVNQADEGQAAGMATDAVADDGMDDGMAPVDATDPMAAEEPDPMGAGAAPEMDPEADATPDQMPNFEDGAEPAPQAGGAAPAGNPPPAGQAAPKPAPGQEEEFPMEDKDVTSPQSSKYTSHVKEDPRKITDAGLPGKGGSDLDEIGPDVKEDDGTGTNSPVARKGGKD
jgi:hypothetical protein